MSAPENEPMTSAAERDRGIRIGVIFWSAVIAVIFLFAGWNWVMLAVDGEGSVGTWALAITLTVIAVAGAAYLWSAFRVVRRLTAPQDGSPDPRA